MPHPEHNNRVDPTSQLEQSTAPGVAIPSDSRARLKYVYLIAVGIWAAWCVLRPTWRGVSYHFDTFGQGGWIETGAFGITGSGSTPFHRRSFLWNPLAIVSIVMGVYCGIRQEFRRQRTEIEDLPNSQNRRKRNT